MQYNANAQQIEIEIHIRVDDTRSHWIFYLKNEIRGKENLDTQYHSIWCKRGGCRILSPPWEGLLDSQTLTIKSLRVHGWSGELKYNYEYL